MFRVVDIDLATKILMEFNIDLLCWFLIQPKITCNWRLLCDFLKTLFGGKDFNMDGLSELESLLDESRAHSANEAFLSSIWQIRYCVNIISVFTSFLTFNNQKLQTVEFRRAGETFVSCCWQWCFHLCDQKSISTNLSINSDIFCNFRHVKDK